MVNKARLCGIKSGLPLAAVVSSRNLALVSLTVPFHTSSNVTKLRNFIHPRHETFVNFCKISRLALPFPMGGSGLGVLRGDDPEVELLANAF